MKKGILTWFVGLLLTSFVLAQSPSTKSPITGRAQSGTGKYIALLVGVDNYPNLSDNEQLKYPVRDVGVFASLLKKYSFRSEDIHTLTNPTQAQFWGELNQLKTKIQASDYLVIFITLHGQQEQMSGEKEYFWLPKDARPAQPTSWIAVSEFVKQLKQISYKRVLVIVDACFSGSIFQLPQRNNNPQIFSGTMTRFKGNGRMPELAEPSKHQLEILQDLPSSKAITSGTSSQSVPDESLFFGALRQTLTEYHHQYLLGMSLFYSIYNSVTEKGGTIPLYQTIGTLPNAEGSEFIFFNPTGRPTTLFVKSHAIKVEQSITRYTLSVTKGEQVQIQAKGIITVGQWVGRVTPSGKKNLDNLPIIIDGNTYNVIPNLPHGALLYRIAGEKTWHYCGDQCMFEATQTKDITIELLVNDADRGNNIGHFDVTIFSK